MSINSNMQAVKLQEKKKVDTKSGAKKYDWVDKETIYVSIYKTNDMINTQSVRYNESTHTGLTFYKNIKEGINRLLDNNGVIYEIKGANPQGRLTNLLLKVVDTNV
jgi:hypothetical protein